MIFYAPRWVLLLTVVAGALSGEGQKAFAYYVSINAGTNASIAHSNPTQDVKTINTGQLTQATTSGSITSSLPFQCFPIGTCPPNTTGSAQTTWQGTASLGTLVAGASGSANFSSPTIFPPALYNASGTLVWQDTFTITREGDFKATLTLDSAVLVNAPNYNCPTSTGDATATVSLAVSGPPVELSMGKNPCSMTTNPQILTQTFHAIVGQQLVMTTTLVVGTSGAANLFSVQPATSVSVASFADVLNAPHIATFTLDPASPGAAYITESGTIYTSVVPNQVPVANAGIDQTVHVGRTVTLDGTGSADPDGNTPLTYAWTVLSKPSGSNTTLTNPTTSMPSFVTDAVGDYIFSLIVTDTLGAQSAAAQVKVSTANSNPVADAGPDQAITTIGTVVQLNGSTSYDPDGDTISYNWTLSQRPVGSSASLSSISAANPSFTADVHGDFVATLMVTDQFGAASSVDSVTISFNNLRPVANAGGNQAAFVGQAVQLNGSGSSDPNGDSLSYSWSLVSKPTGSSTALTNVAGPQTSLTADRAGSFVVSLVVNDGLVDSDPDTVTISVTSRQDQVVQTIRQAINMINGLNVAVFRNDSMPNTLTNKLNAALQAIDQNRYQDALDNLQEDVLGKTNGCMGINQLPDRNDWILNCTAQGQVATPLTQAITLLRALLP
jgi:hypothetical protein